MDDCCIISKKNSTVADVLIESLRTGTEEFKLEDEGTMDKFLGVDIKRNENGSVELSQPHLITRFLDLINIEENEHFKDYPAIKSLLYKDTDGPSRKCDWNYRTAVGMLTYLTGSTRPDISMAVHQCARFCNFPRLIHERAIRHIGKYLSGNRKKGIIFTLEYSKGLEVFVDADFAGNWDKADSENIENIMSRTGYVLSYAGCPIHWKSVLQTEVCLSTAESEYCALSQALREVLPTMTFLEEINKFIDIQIPTPQIKCKVYEDNNACITMATSNKFSPRTKHIALKYHHFRLAVQKKQVEILPIDTDEQLADIFTKPVQGDKYIYLRGKLIGW